MTRIFIDSSVFIAAILSTRGFAFQLLTRMFTNQHVLLFSADVLIEAERNIRLKAPAKLPTFEHLRHTLVVEMVTPTPQLVQQVTGVVHSKDTIILAAAVAGNVDWLATYDRKHLLAQRAAVLDTFGITIATPEDIVNALSL